MTLSRKLVYTLGVLIVSGLVFWGSQIKLPVVDNVTDDYFANSLKNATVAYASLRGVNAVVSVIKESSVEVSPAGVGLSLAAGQMLDPVDDMTERASSVVVMALVSLGVQKIGYEVGQVISLQLLSIVLLFLIPFVWQNKLDKKHVKKIYTVVFILLALRFMLPAFAGLSGWVHNHYFAEQQKEALSRLSFITDQQLSIKDMWSGSHQDQSWWSRLYGEQKQSRQWFATLGELANQLDTVISALVQLMLLFLTEWLIQVILLPILGGWFLFYLARQSFSKANL